MESFDGRSRIAAHLLLMAALFGVSVFAASLAQARPGGGQGFTHAAGFHAQAALASSHRPSGGLRGDASAGAVGLLLGGVILTLGAAIRAVRSVQEYDSRDEFEPDGEPLVLRRIDWTPLLARDPEFSPAVFEEFVRRLHAQAHQARGDAGALASLAPHLSAEARKALAVRELSDARISRVVVGSMQITALQVGAEVARIDLRFQSNLGAEDASWYLVEDWQLVREAVDGGCDWYVIGVRLRDAGWRPPALSTCPAEAGPELPTLVSPSFAEQWAALLADDPTLDPEALFARVHVIHERLEAAWAAGELSIVRPCITDAVHDYLAYWLEAYRRHGLIHCHEDAVIRRIELVKLQRDARYDVLTVRIFVRALDYTIREGDDWVVGGSTTSPRHESEYWTLIRAAKVRGEPKWLLSRIEADHCYLG